MACLSPGSILLEEHLHRICWSAAQAYRRWLSTTAASLQNNFLLHVNYMRTCRYLWWQAYHKLKYITLMTLINTKLHKKVVHLELLLLSPRTSNCEIVNSSPSASLLDGFFYYFISEFCVLLALRCGDRETSLIQNGRLSVACCSTSHCVLVSRCVFR